MLKFLNSYLQELGAIVALKEKRAIVKKAIRKVRSFSVFDNLNCCSRLRHSAVFFVFFFRFFWIFWFFLLPSSV